MELQQEPHSPDPSEPVQLAHRTTNFFIDDILRPDFGCRKEREADREGQPDNKPTLHETPHSEFYNDTSSSSSSSSSTVSSSASKAPGKAPARKDTQPILWPAWVYCTRYSDRPSSGPRTRKLKKKSHDKADDKRPRTAFTTEQLQRLKTEFQVNRYITEQRRQTLAQELSLNESQIKIWFQNKRAKIKKSSGYKNTLALQLMAQGLYNHSTTTVQEEGHD